MTASLPAASPPGVSSVQAPGSLQQEAQSSVTALPGVTPPGLPPVALTVPPKRVSSSPTGDTKNCIYLVCTT